MHTVILTRGAYREVETWREFMQAQMWKFPQVILEKDKEGKFIPDGEEEDGTKKYKHLKYPNEQVDLATGKIIHKKGDDVKIVKTVQGVLRPMQLWEYIYPEECHREFLAMLNQHTPATFRKEMAPIAWSIRKAMHLTKIPLIAGDENKIKEEITDRFVPTTTVAQYLIGSRTDPKKDFIFKLADGTTQGFYQEGL